MHDKLCPWYLPCIDGGIHRWEFTGHHWCYKCYNMCLCNFIKMIREDERNENQNHRLQSQGS